MKKLLTIYFIIATFATAAQNFDHLMVKRQLDCSDISYNSALLFEKYFTESKKDSLRSLLSYWGSKCGTREPNFRAKILFALNEGVFQDTMLTSKALNHIFNYQNRMDMIKYDQLFIYDEYKPQYGYIPVDREFDRFTQQLAKEIKPRFDEKSMEYLLCEFYSTNYDTILTRIQDKQYSNSLLYKQYYKAIEHYLNMPEFHMSWITGVWIPTGKLSKLGTHPEFGYQMGSKKGLMSYDLTLLLKFGDTRNTYYAYRNGSDPAPEATNHFFGGYVGFEVGKDVLKIKAHEVQLSGGVAFDGFDALEEDKENDLKAASTFTFNFNLGVGYRYYTNSNFYMGLRARINFVDYRLSDVVDFNGFPVTIHFVVGGLMNQIKQRNLQALKYNWRRN